MPEKLVRDNIPALAAANGQEVTFRVVRGRELVSFLRVKVDEELAEFDQALDREEMAEELADVVSVLRGLAMALKLDSAVNEVMFEKTLLKGAFGKGYVMKIEEN